LRDDFISDIVHSLELDGEPSPDKRPPPSCSACWSPATGPRPLWW